MRAFIAGFCLFLVADSACAQQNENGAQMSASDIDKLFAEVAVDKQMLFDDINKLLASGTVGDSISDRNPADGVHWTASIVSDTMRDDGAPCHIIHLVGAGKGGPREQNFEYCKLPDGSWVGRKGPLLKP